MPAVDLRFTSITLLYCEGFNHSFMRLLVLENKYQQINSRQGRNFMTIIT